MKSGAILWKSELLLSFVIKIDEANHICSGILNDLKIFFNFEIDSKDRAVLLAGHRL